MRGTEMVKARGAPHVWMRSIKAHTYHGHPQPEGAIYLVHPEDVENIENLRFALREAPPQKAVREP